MRKKLVARRSIVWNFVLLNFAYNMSCILIALASNGMVKNEEYFSRWALAKPYCWYIVGLVVLFVVSRIWYGARIIIHDQKTDWPKDFEQRFAKRNNIYVVVFVMFMILVGSGGALWWSNSGKSARTIYAVWSHAVLLVILLVEALIARFLHEEDKIKMTWAAKKEILEAEISAKVQEFLEKGKKNNRANEGGGSNFKSQNTDSGEEWNPKNRKTEDEEAKKDDYEDEDDDLVSNFGSDEDDDGESDDYDYSDFLYEKDQKEANDGGFDVFGNKITKN